LKDAGSEKVVLFAQPVETVAVVVRYLRSKYRVEPAVIVGNQSDEERTNEVERFRNSDGPQFLVSSRAGGEGLNLQVARRLIHLDVPWNPMELEQRIGRVHRFGSRKTVLVDTLIVQGTREVHMYRIARDKLRLIATQMDAEQFEVLFSRVMSLVPPKELESLLGNAPAARVDDYAAESIGALVREGYAIWQEFDQRFRDQAEQIRALQPGEATWADLRDFLVRSGGAKPAPDAKTTVFELDGDEILDRGENVPALQIGEQLFVCADTAGASAESVDGQHIRPIGLNHSLAREQVRLPLLAAGVGAGYVNRPAGLGSEFPPRFGVLAFLRHAVRIAPGATTERALTFHVVIVDEVGTATELDSAQRAQLTRELFKAVRVRDPGNMDLAKVLGPREREVLETLRALSEDERAEGVRPAVWPVAAFVVG
jgi:hypothetical protein